MVLAPVVGRVLVPIVGRVPVPMVDKASLPVAPIFPVPVSRKMSNMADSADESRDISARGRRGEEGQRLGTAHQG